MNKVTEWYPPEIEPVREGRYHTVETLGTEPDNFQKQTVWKHGYWHFPWGTCMVQDRYWRGLTRKPK